MRAVRRPRRWGGTRIRHRIPLAVALAAAIAEICRELVPLRRLRAAARVVKRKMSNYRVKRAEHRAWPQPTRSPAHAVAVLHPKAAGP